MEGMSVNMVESSGLRLTKVIWAKMGGDSGLILIESQWFGKVEYLVKD